MHPAVMAARRQTAQERLLAAAETLADRFGLQEQHAALAAARHRDSSVATLLQVEAVSDLMEAVANATAPTATIPPQAARLAAMTAAEVQARIDATDDPADLDALAALEGDPTHGKHRSTVHRAIDKRRQQLAADAKAADADYTEAGG